MKNPDALDLLIVRHGESEGNRDRTFTGHGPSPLTPRGVRQAEATSVAVAALKPDAVYVSDLVRTVATAAPLVKHTGLSPVLTPRLRERDMGGYTGMTFAEVAEKDPPGWAALVARDLSFTPPGGESHLACAQRMKDFARDLLVEMPTGRVVLVSHGVAIHHLLRALLHLEDPAAVHIHVDNCSVSRLVIRPDGSVRVMAINDVSHLVALELPSA